MSQWFGYGLAVMAGGALGCLCRYVLIEIFYLLFGRGFPWGTLSANVLGSFLIGFIIILITHILGLSEFWRLFLIVGFLGGFTTFSSFSLDAITLFQNELWGKALVYIFSSCLLSLLATILGIYLAKKLGA